MALTMVHLAAADLWARAHPEYRESPDFFYGVISPDAIHVRDGNDKSHKNEIHLNNWVSPHPDDVIRYWMEHAGHFDIGYGVHVLTDGQWVPRYKERLPGIMRPDGLLDTGIYYNDTFVTDFRLYGKRPRLREIWDMVARGSTPRDHPLLTAHELSQWREDLIAAYAAECPHNAPVRFIDEDYIDAFLQDCIPLIEQTYQKFIKNRY